MKNYLLLFLFIVAFSVNHAVAQEETTNNETVITYFIGSYKISTLSEGVNNGSPNILSGASEEILKKYLPTGAFKLQTNAFLIQTDNKNVLIDTGHGRNLFTNLNSSGVSEDKVDVVLLTHMHGDHIGGLLKDGKAAFPNAELYVSQVEHDYWMGRENNTNIRNIFDAYKTKLHLFEPVDLGSDKQNLFSGFQGIKAYGHTPGHTVFMIESEGERLMIWGDVTHATEVQMPHPEIPLSFDVNHDMARETRKKILEYVTQNKIRVGGMHILFPSIGDIRKGEGKEGAYVFTPLCVCEGI